MNGSSSNVCKFFFLGMGLLCWLIYIVKSDFSSIGGSRLASHRVSLYLLVLIGTIFFCASGIIQAIHDLKEK